ncbi:Protein MEI2-like 1 [Cucumispora dikerogammari]|nr:Protein MEI2-like 1 [Cucumispora dikerogammari]
MLHSEKTNIYEEGKRAIYSVSNNEPFDFNNFPIFIKKFSPKSYDSSHLYENQIEFDKENIPNIPLKIKHLIKEPLNIDIERIRQDEDRRTTIMLANIPNRYTLPMLLDLLDEISAGKYNFVYLRMDFINKCNVGYAFINFVNSRALLNFYIEANNKCWSKFQSNKITSITYATIQGESNLIEKFKKSKIMKQEEQFRPVCLFTEGVLKGSFKRFS